MILITATFPARQQSDDQKEVKLTLCNPVLHITHPQTRSLLSNVQMMTSFAQGDFDLLEEKRVCKTILHILASDFGLPLIEYLLTNGCVTSLELWKRIPGIKRQGVEYHRQTLEGLGLVKTFTTIGDILGVPAKYQSAQIWGWIGLPTEYVQDARRRYASFFRDGAQRELTGKAFEVLVSASFRGELGRSLAMETLKPMYPEVKARVRILEQLKPQLHEQGIHLTEGR